MEHTGYTKGEWTIKEWTYENGVLRKIMIQTDKDAVAEVLGLYRPDDLENKEMKANARLIAAAPDLLDALKQIVGNERRYEIPYDDYMQAVAALGRAEGREGLAMKCPKCNRAHLGIKKYAGGDRLYIHKQWIGPGGMPEIVGWCYVRYIHKPKVALAPCRIKQAAMEAAKEWR